MYIFRMLALLVTVLVISACTGKPVKTYSGDLLGDEEVVLVSAGENIEVSKVDDKQMKKYLLSNIETNYALTPGKHRIIFNYTSVWAKSPKGSDDSRSELVESAPHIVEFEAKAGERLRFDIPEMEDMRQAKEFVARFSADLVDADGRVVASAVPYDAVAEEEKKQAEKVAAEGVTLDNSLPVLDGMKVLWEKASAEDKKAFLKWAFK